MLARVSLALLITLSLAALAFMVLVSPKLPPKPTLTVAIALPIYRDTRVIVLPTKGAKRAPVFHVVICNVSDKPVSLWKEWCSWGYYNLAFEIDQDNGKVHTIKKKEMGWCENYPDLLELQPGDHYVIPVTFDPNTWDVSPVNGAADQPRHVRMRAVYSIPPKDDTQRLGVWTGEERSSYESYYIWGNL